MACMEDSHLLVKYTRKQEERRIKRKKYMYLLLQPLCPFFIYFHACSFALVGLTSSSSIAEKPRSRAGQFGRK